MINKLLYIRNCGRFINCTLIPQDWDGTFDKINTIYAENGSGKTTFTQIIKSLSKNDKDLELVSKRKTLQTSADIDIAIMSDKRRITFHNDTWDCSIKNIEIYDTYYAESNVYIISLGNYNNPSSFYDLILAQNNRDVIKEMLSAIKKHQKIRNAIKTLSYKIKEHKGTVLENEYKLKLARMRSLLQQAKENRQVLEKEIDQLIELNGTKYLNKVNDYLARFNPNLRLTKLNNKGQQLVYHLQINGITARCEDSSISLKHSLSEGDKSSLSLSFFLARLDMMTNLADKIVVFDDPLSSFDTRRRSMTASILSRIAKESAQFFLLSHDLNFIKDFCRKVRNSTNLKIEWKDNSSKLLKNSIELESMTGVSKDLYILQQYISYGATSDFERRDIARCIRPAIEGVFRIKYFSIVKDNEWLGDFLKHIRDCDVNSPLERLKGDIYNKISDINDYSQKYHHSNPKYLEEPIYDQELGQYVRMTLNVIMYI